MHYGTDCLSPRNVKLLLNMNRWRVNGEEASDVQFESLLAKVMLSNTADLARADTRVTMTSGVVSVGHDHRITAYYRDLIHPLSKSAPSVRSPLQPPWVGGTSASEASYDMLAIWLWIVLEFLVFLVERILL